MALLIPALQTVYQKTCALADEKARDVKNLCDQLSDKEDGNEALNRQLKLVEDALTHANTNIE